MLPQFLLQETTVRTAGASSDIDLGQQLGGTLLLTLGITRIIEQESLDVSIWGSADGAEWGAKPLVPRSDIDLGQQLGGTLLLTLGITRIIEQESLDVSIWGSADGAEWGAKPLVS